MVILARKITTQTQREAEHNKAGHHAECVPHNLAVVPSSKKRLAKLHRALHCRPQKMITLTTCNVDPFVSE